VSGASAIVARALITGLRPRCRNSFIIETVAIVGGELGHCDSLDVERPHALEGTSERHPTYWLGAIGGLRRSVATTLPGAADAHVESSGNAERSDT
jgi:hypothetical protein